MAILEQAENNKVKIKFTVTPERFREGLHYSFKKNKNLVTIPGFRKGKAPRQVVERMYGKDFFYNDALDYLLPDAYEGACDELELDPVYRPSINLESVSEDEGAVFTAEIYVKPDISIDNYYGIAYTKHETEATDSDIQEKLQQEREKNARQVSVDRPAEMGDILSINFKGYVDDEPFEGGEGKDYDLKLGSDSFIDTFEDQLAGHSVGDDVKVNVKFPDEYHHAELSGKDAVFEVEILDIKTNEYPEIDDEFAQDVSEFDTLEEYRNDLAEQITKDKEAHATEHKRKEVSKKLSELLSAEIPQVMYDARLEEMLDEFQMRIRYQGLDVEAYMKYYGITEDSLKESWKDNAENDVKVSLALEAVAKKENMEVTDEDFREYIVSNLNPDQDADAFISKLTSSRKKDMSAMILSKKAFDFVLDKAIAVENNEIPEVI